MVDQFSTFSILSILTALVFALLFIWALKKQKSCDARAIKYEDELNSLKQKYSSIISQEEEIARLSNEVNDMLQKTNEVRQTYAEKRKYLKELEKQISIYDEKLGFAELGVYEPHFDFSDSEEFKKKIKEVREEQKRMVSAKEATISHTNWHVDGSLSKGQAMINRQTKLTMRGFNNECEAAIANTRWNNVTTMEKRIINAANQINKANASMSLELNPEYVRLKLVELFLTHEYREKQKQEKEERAELKRAEKEEAKLLADAEAAEKREKASQKLLDKARKEANVDLNKIAELEAQIAEAHDEYERARSMAELTKSGFVYIISNVGSFGEDVVKIGLTRRVNPDDRVRELGDASVPFTFDTHAMIYSDEAPALEKALHDEFADRRVNMSNMRKEFFRVTLNEVEEAVKRLEPNANFFKDREAQEWHETVARRNSELMKLKEAEASKFPDTI